MKNKWNIGFPTKIVRMIYPMIFPEVHIVEIHYTTSDTFFYYQILLKQILPFLPVSQKLRTSQRTLLLLSQAGVQMHMQTGESALSSIATEKNFTSSFRNHWNWLWNTKYCVTLTRGKAENWNNDFYRVVSFALKGK